MVCYTVIADEYTMCFVCYYILFPCRQRLNHEVHCLLDEEVDCDCKPKEVIDQL